MSIWTILEGGMNMPTDKTLGRRLTNRFGRFLAARRKNVTIARNALISPEAKICARAGAICIGAGSTVAPGACVQGSVTIGENCSIQMYTIVCGYEKAPIVIGNNVRIAAHCMMVSANHRFDDPEVPICRQGLNFAPIVIEDDVWIAARVNIMAGVTVGKGSVLAAGAVVTKDVPPYSVMAGVPARAIGRRGEKKAKGERE